MTLRALYIDFNSYFASVEQHLVPALRVKPVAVLPVMAETTCCIAASYEAKAFGIRTGTRVSDARLMCPGLITVEARAHLYIEYHHKLVEIVESCTHVEKTLSIDEMVCKLTGSQQKRENALALASSIKQKIAKELSEHIRCSIGIAPNTFLSKVASNMQKPDGCVVLEAHDLPDKLYPLKLRSLNGIGRRMEERLNHHGINTVRELYAANRQQLRAAWGSIEGERYYDKLRGLELFEVKNDRSSLGHSHVLPPELRTHHAALSVLHRLLQKACMRLRTYALYASVISVRVKFLGRPTWVAESACSPTDDTLMLTHALEQLWQTYPARKNIPYAVGISLTGLGEHEERTLDLFEPLSIESEKKLNSTLDKLNMRYGKNTVYFGGAHNALSYTPLRIAFNHIPDLANEDIVTKEK
ncbi:MAG TPA: DNA polymerase [Methylophilaceae bacterium]|nr:DNA polymerase [Methylotenera sp.]HSH71613.1 DNA polymerase [Methylophilaceae bacterium]